MTIKQMIIEACKKYKGKYIYTVPEGEGDKRIKYEEFIRDVYRASAYFVNMELQNEPIAIWGKNSYEWVVIYCAILFTKNIVVPLDNDMSSKEAELFMTQLHCRLLLCDSEKSQSIKTNFSDNVYVLKDIVNKAMGKYTNWKNTVNAINTIYVDDNDNAMIICTSGTTSLVKKVVLSHNNIASNVVAVSKKINISGKGLLVLPLSHMYSLTAAALVAIYSGAENVFSRHVRFFTREIGCYKPNFIFLVPMLVERLYDYLTKNEAYRREISKSLNMIFCGGAPLSKDIIDKFSALGIYILNGYGMTECSPVISTNTKSDNRVGSVGRALDGISIRVLNADDDGVGELYVKGSSVMRGYLNDAEANQKSFEGEWFKTEDIVKVDEEGYIFIKGRAKNIILSGNGQNVYPEEIERALLSYNEIEEVLVYQKDNKIVAEVYPNYNNEICDDKRRINKAFQTVIGQFNRKQPYYKNISELIIREQQFEKTNISKIKRAAQQDNAQINL